MTLPSYAQNELDLPAMGSWPASRHLFDDMQRQALLAAEAAGRPLLVRGDPGTGKSQLAHAAAVAANRFFLPFVVDSRTESSDLMWHYDAVARLADAHLVSVLGAEAPKALDARQYIQPGPLWWAFDWRGALAQGEQARTPASAPAMPEAWQSQQGCVLLIDEIDKAEAEVPNGLLEALGNGRFTIPLSGGQVVERPAGQPAPLVIITTNDERELPAAFLRRCMVLTLALPQGAALKPYLVHRGRLHFGDWAASNEGALQQAAEDLLQYRGEAESAGVYKPGLAEYLDLLRALREVGGDPLEQLQRLRQFAYRKQPVD